MRKETDLARVKMIAHVLLDMPIAETSFSPAIVSHPFTSTGVTAAQNEDGNITVVDLLHNKEDYRQEAGTPPKLDGGSQRLDLRQVSFEGDISEYDGTLSFYMPVTFDPDAVFGTNVTSDSNGDWLNVYANYDLETGGPEQSLTVVLVCGDGNEFEFSYPLTASDREQLREKMEGYCQSQAGMSLDNYRQELCSEESSMEQGPQM